MKPDPFDSGCGRAQGRRSVVRIAHAYGNTLHDVDIALAADVDMIELDLWYHGGELYARHERRLRWLPILVDRKMHSHKRGFLSFPFGRRYYIRPDLRRVTLDDVMERVAGKKGLLVDLKGSYKPPHLEAFVQKLNDTIRKHRAESWAVVCGQVYTPLHRLREVAPDLEVRYSIERPYQWERFLRLMEADPPARATCMAYGFIDAEKARIMEDNGVNLYCWTVDDPAAAERLVDEGVDGIISNNLELLQALPRATPSASEAGAQPRP